MKNQYLARVFNDPKWLGIRLQSSFLAVLCAVAFLWSSKDLHAQVSSYGYTNTNLPYSEITGGTLLGTSANDDHRFVDPAVLAGSTIVSSGPGFPIGFNFVFNGYTFDQVAVNSNGWIFLGTSSVTPSCNAVANSSSPISYTTSTVVTPTDLAARISAFGRDLQGQTGAELRIETIGDAPNRKCIVQWKNYRKYSTSTTLVESLNFQIQLHEGTNNVVIAYGTMTTNGSSSTAQVGLRGQPLSTASNFRGITSTTSWTSPSMSTGASNSMTYSPTVLPPSGTTLTFSPPLVCSGTPAASTVTPAIQNICLGSTPGNLTSTGQTPGFIGFTYQWEQSTDGGQTWVNAVGGSNSTTLVYTPPVFNGPSIQYRLATTCSASSQVAYSSVAQVDPPGSPATQATALTATSTSQRSLALSWTAGTGSRRMVVISNAPIVDPSSGSGPAVTANTVYSGSGQQIVFDGTGTSVSITGLTCGTTYYTAVFDYNRCGAAAPFDYYYNTTPGSNVATFTTSTSVALPVNEGFATTTAPASWTTTGWTIGSARGVTGNPGNNIYRNLWSSATTGTFTTAVFGPMVAGYRLKFDYKVANYSSPYAAPSAGWGNFKVSLGTNCASTFNLLDSITDAGTGWVTKTYDLSAYSSGDLAVMVDAQWLAGDYDLAFDNFVLEPIPACDAPSALTAGSVTNNSATLSWTASASSNNYEVAIQAAGAGAPAGSGVAVSGTTYTATGLSSATNYEYYVRTVCSGGNSAWAGPFAFSTAVCDAANTCNYTINMTDTYGDGWDGTVIGLRQSGILVGTFGGSGFTSGGTATATIALCPGLNTEIVLVTAGSYPEEKRFTILDPFGVQVYSLATATTPLPSVFGSFTSSCTPPACQVPSGLSASAVTETGATIAWTAGGSETSWEISIQAPGIGAPTGNGTNITANPYVATGLTSNTSYEVYLRSVCSPTNKSNWIGPISIRTLCGTFATPLFESFEVTQGTVFCWSGNFAAGSTPGWQWIRLPAGAAPSNQTPALPDTMAMRIPFYGIQSGSFNLNTPTFTATTAPAVLKFNYAYAAYSSAEIDQLEILASSDAGTTYSSLSIMDGGPTGPLNTGGTTTASFVPSSSQWGTRNMLIPVGTNKISFKGISAYGNNLYIDNVSVTPCSGTATAVSATICQGQSYNFGTQTLTATGVYNQTLVATNGCDSVVTLTLTVNPIASSTITETIPNGGSFTVCGEVYNATGTYTKICTAANGCDSVVTLNLTVEPPVSVTIGTTNACNVGDTVQVPVTMAFGRGIGAISLAINYDTTKLAFVDAINLNPDLSTMLVNAAVFNGATQVRAGWYATSSAIDLSGLMFAIRFVVTDSASLNFDLATPGNCEIADFDAIPFVGATFNNGSVRRGPATETVNLSIAFGTSLTICGQTYNATGTYTNVCPGASVNGCDSIVTLNLTILPPPCAVPSALVASGITTTGATFAWNAGGTETEWEIAIQTAVGQPTGNGTAITTNPYTATGLASNTIHYVYLRSVCSPTDKSNWIGPISFRTLCSVFNLPFFESFETAQGTVSCWSGNFAVGSTPGWQYIRLSSGSAPSNQTPALPDTFAMRIPFYNIVSGSYSLNTPTFTANPNGAVLTFNYAYAAYSSAEIDKLEILSSTDGGATYNSLEIMNGGPNGPLNTGGTTTGSFVPTAAQWGLKTVNLPANTNRISFKGISEYGNNLYLDNVLVVNPPPCSAPTAPAVVAGSIGSSTASISWTAPATVPANGYQLFVSTSSTAPDAGSAPTVSSATSPASLTGLMPFTVYNVWVRSSCSVGFSSWVGPVTLTTTCLESNVPNSESFDSYPATGGTINTGTAVPPCWTRANGTSTSSAWRVFALTGSNIGSTSGDNILASFPTVTTAKNDWAFTTGYNLVGGTSYTLRFKVRAPGNGPNRERLGVYVANARSSAAMLAGSRIYNDSSLQASGWQSRSARFTPATSGVYYLGIRAYSVANAGYIGIDDWSLELTTSEISGVLRYQGGASVLDNSTVSISGAATASTTTGANGAFSLTGLGNGAVVLTASTNKPWGGITATDALATTRHYQGIGLVTGLNLDAADVNLSNLVNATDALMIINRFNGTRNNFPAGDWKFENKNYNLNFSEETTDLFGICLGDVNNSYAPSSSRQFIGLTLAEEGVQSTQQAEWLDVRVDRSLELGALTVVLDIPQGVQIEEVVSSLPGGRFDYNIHQGQLRLTWFDVAGTSLNSDQSLFRMRVTAQNSVPATAWVLGEGSEMADPMAQVYDQVGLRMPSLRSLNDGLAAGVYPNPTNGVSKLNLSLPATGEVRVRAVDVLGKTVANMQMNAVSMNTEMNLDLSHLANGRYELQIELESNGRVYRTRVPVQKAH
ncbi:MAG: fibronectin type III domain-containing protein [Bacteroidia bacterium]